MKRISDHAGLFQTDTELVLSLLKKWQPQSLELDEREQEGELYGWLQKSLPDVPMTTQHGLAKGRADIVIEDRHVIELKLNFQDVHEFDRCIGQLERYRQRWVQKERGPVYLVVVGHSERDFRDMLHVWFDQANEMSTTFFDEKRFYLVEKLEL